MSTSKVSVIIASYNNRAFIGDCIESVLGQSHADVEVVLVDNASTDGTASFVKENYPGVKVIENDTNQLFCKAQNTGIRATAGEFVLALNSDVVLDEKFIEEAVGAMDSDPKVGSVTGRILRSGGAVIDTTGLFLGRGRKPVDRGYGEPDDGRYMEPGYVFGAGGVAPLYRRNMLEDTALEGEYFDETYGAFCEDLDLAWRAAGRGWKAYYTPLAIAYHMRGATARTETPRFRFLEEYAFVRLPDSLKSRRVLNRYMTILKNDTVAGIMLNLPFIIFYDLRQWFFMLVFSPRAALGVIRGLGLLPIAWRRRRLVHGS